MPWSERNALGISRKALIVENDANISAAQKVLDIISTNKNKH